MGLGLHAVDAIGREHAYSPIKGDVLFIGRQATYFTASGLAAQLRSHGHAVDTSAIEVDRTTIHRLPGYGEIVTDRSIFHALGIDHVKALDASAYEGAEIVHDLNRPLPDNLKATADFIVDGSTLDNVFDPAMTLRNYAQLLRPGGRLLAINTLNNRQCAFTICSPDWFLDYFVENGFSDCKVYVCAGFAGAYNSYWLDTEYMASQRPGKLVFPPMLWDYYTLVFAEKGPASTTECAPVQHPYRSPDEWTRYEARLAAINRSPRPHLARSVGMLLPRLSRRGFKWMDKTFKPRSLRPSLPRQIMRLGMHWRYRANR
jgi:SAM-dependent methyltransferase